MTLSDGIFTSTAKRKLCPVCLENCGKEITKLEKEQFFVFENENMLTRKLNMKKELKQT